MIKLERYESLEESTSYPSSPSSSSLSPARASRGYRGSSHGGNSGPRWLRFKSLRRRENQKGTCGYCYRRSSRKRGREASSSSSNMGPHSRGGVPPAYYAGWVYHVGTSSLGYPFCTDRFLVIKGKYVTMFKRNPVEYPRAVCIFPLPTLSDCIPLARI